MLYKRRLFGRVCTILFAAILLASISAAKKQGILQPTICGVKLYLNDIDTKAKYPDYSLLFDELKQTNINAIFTTLYEGKTAFYRSSILPVRDTTIDINKFRILARKNNLLFGAICHIFYDADIIEQRPNLIPVDQFGNTSYVNWQKLVCPSDASYRKYKLSIVKEIAATVHPDIMSLDFIRFPTTWELIPPSIRPEEMRNFCFCSRCLSQFQKKYSVVIPESLHTVSQKAQWILTKHGDKWEQWKTTTITSFVKAAKKEITAIDPAIKIAIHIVPWSERTYQNAICRIAGQDAASLSAYADYFSPMIYHKLIGFPNEYIRTLTSELYKKTKKRVLPSIQAAQIEAEGELPALEFKQSLDYALLPPSCGTLIYNWSDFFVKENSSNIRLEKKNILRNAFKEFKMTKW